MNLRRLALGLAALLGASLALFLGVAFRADLGTPVAPRVVLASPAPPPPEVRVPEAPLEPTEEEIVVVTLPRPNRGIGTSLAQVQRAGWPVSDERLRLTVAPWDDLPPVPDPDLIDDLRFVLDILGTRPADSAEVLARISPALAMSGLHWEAEWRQRDVLRGLAPGPADRLFARERRLAEAILSTAAPESPESRGAAMWLMQCDMAEAPVGEREQAVWESVVRNFEHDPPGARFFIEQFVGSPDIQLEDHTVFAGKVQGHPAIADLMLRDALRDGDDAWARYWWAELQNSSVYPEGASMGYWGAVLENRDQLAGFVNARLDQPALTWQDGLRRSAVRCDDRGEGTPLSARIHFRQGAWQALELDQPGAFADCLLSGADPLPREGQRAQLVVIRAEVGE